MEADEDIVDKVLDVVPSEITRAVSAALSRLPMSFSRAQVFEAVPCGWYVLTRTVPTGDDVIQIIPVHNHDKPCWDALIGYLSALTPLARQKASILREYTKSFRRLRHSPPSVRGPRGAVDRPPHGRRRRA